MKNLLLITLTILLSYNGSAQDIQKDVIETSEGKLTIHFVGHGSLIFEYNGLIIHADPSSREADYSQLPDANLILITHHHGDHFDPTAIKEIATDKTTIIANQKSADQDSGIEGIQVMKNGEEKMYKEIKIEAVPAYNLVHMRSENNPYHPKGEGNGYVITFGDKRVFVAGDTENTPEMKALEDIDIAFLPMNLPYTMTPEMVANAAKGFKPDVLYPYHFGSTDTSKIVELMKDEEEIEIRLRDME